MPVQGAQRSLRFGSRPEIYDMRSIGRNGFLAVMRYALHKGLLCGTKQFLADAAVAHAENARLCIICFLRAQHSLIIRPFMCFERCRSQTDLWLIIVATDAAQTFLPVIDLDQKAFCAY